MRALKLALTAIVVILVAVLGTLRVTGLEPPWLDPNSPEFVKAARTNRPGLWLAGEVVREPVTNWDFINQVNDPVTKNTILLETRTWYGIPHSVRINGTPRGDKLYIGGTEQDERLEKGFPYSKAWWSNLMRDPRARLKIGGKLYEVNVILMADRAEVAQLLGRNPVSKAVGPDGQERVRSVAHYWRVYQRNVTEYGDGTPPPKPAAPPAQ
ncbi:MAG: hypothetical protein U0Q55_07880 [Vicinamibacterales bacterium]